MQTNFSAEQLARPVIADAARILGDCVHYGFCTAVCPTYVLLRDENDAPRGRIDLIRKMLESGGAPDAATVGYIDRCLSCNSCMTTCAAKVDYMHLADIGRAYIETHYRRPLGDRLFRALVGATVPHPRRFRLAARAAALARPFASLFPPRLANMVRMAPRAFPRAPEGAAAHPAAGTRRMRVALLAGCVQQALAPGINCAAIRVLTRHGCEVVVAPDADCCGAFTLHMGKESSAKAAARRTIAAWRRTIASGGLDAVVVTASGCGTTVKDYGRIFAHDPEIAADAAAIGAMALDVTELLHRLGLRAPERPVPLAVAYHDACSLQHAQKVSLPPRALLERAGFDVREVPERHFCCGSAGAYNMLQPAIARQLGQRKAANIASTGAAAIAAGNLGCMTQIAMYSRLPVVHTVELLDWATGGPLPDAFAGIPIPEPRRNEDGPPPETATSPRPAADAGPAVW